MEFIIITVAFIALTWYWSKPDTSSRSRETLNEVCPNDRTGDFAVFPDDEVKPKD